MTRDAKETASPLGEGEPTGAFTKGNFNAVKSGLLMTKVPSRPSTLANHIASSVRFPIVSLCNVLSSGEVVKRHDQLRFLEAVRGSGRADPAHGAQRGEGVEERLKICAIDRAFTLDPFPILRAAADDRFLAISHARETMNVVRLELENRQFLPLQRIDPDLVKQLAVDRHDERLFADSRIDVIALDFAEGQSQERMFAGRRSPPCFLRRKS